MREYGLQPVETLDEMRQRLELQDEEQGTLLAYLDKMHYPLWVTQFYENIKEVTEAIVNAAAETGVGTLELRYSPLIHTYAGLTVRQSIRAVLSGMNHASRPRDMQVGLIVIAMRQHGPAHREDPRAPGHRRGAAPAQPRGGGRLRHRGPRARQPAAPVPQRVRDRRAGGLGLTAHAGEDPPPDYVWEAIDVLGATRIGHGCAATADPELLRRLAQRRLVVECCVSSNYHTGAVARGAPHPIRALPRRGRAGRHLLRQHDRVAHRPDPREPARRRAGGHRGGRGHSSDRRPLFVHQAFGARTVKNVNGPVAG